uniref:50S ribosomal protein L14, plastid-like n=2 Tax=Nicotiana TaxID=4085 RepID=A0A1S4BKL0_TOBAC|nr:PREDICTED: 50S ribosomal protein L14, plastid-like [Nicotiana sylvestris]XP_016489409.1 PREDICTED: 50S ribosomal protein L14, plastid-like [Nicotiana tabacum]
MVQGVNSAKRRVHHRSGPTEAVPQKRGIEPQKRLGVKRAGTAGAVVWRQMQDCACGGEGAEAENGHPGKDRICALCIYSTLRKDVECRLWIFEARYMVMTTVKKGKPGLRKKVMSAVIVRQRKPWRRKYGVFMYLENNASVIVNPKGKMKGSAIIGPIAKECADFMAKDCWCN